jgi:hypothetical protein
MENKNGIVTYLSPSLGLKIAGYIWVELERELSAEEIAVLPQPEAALCTMDEFNRRDNRGHARSICVSAPGWSGVVEAIRGLQLRAAEEAAKKAAKQAEEDAAKSQIRAAIANPEPSEWFGFDRTNSPWSPWTWGRLVPCQWPENDLMQREINRRNEAARESWIAEMRDLSDQDLMVLNPVAVSNLPPDLKLRRDQLISAEQEEQRKANHAAIAAVLVSAPADVMERFEAGVLSDPTLKTHLSDALFSGIDLAQYELIRDADIEHDDDCDQPGNSCSSEEFSGDMNRAEWNSWKIVRKTLLAAGYFPQLRRSHMWCQNDHCSGEVFRLHARITKIVGGIEVYRNYAI